MKPNTKSLTFEELYNQIFNDGIITKQNKDKLYKSAKAINDIKTIERMAHELDFKNAIKYVEINSKKVIQELFISMDTDSIIKAIENGLDVNSKNDKDSNFLHFAVEQDNRALIKFLIDKNININCQDKDGATALLLASQENNYESIKILIEANADVNLKSKHGYTPLMASVAKFNSIDAAHLLIKSGAEINVQDIRGVSPLMLAAQQNFGSMVLLLLENGANPNLTSIEGYNSLHLPSELGHENIVKILLQTDVNINHQDKDGDTPLMIASYHGFKNIIQILLKKNADLNLQNKKGDTALMKAAYGNHFEVVRLLVEKGAKLNITSKDNYSALAFSMSKNNKEMTTYLINAGENRIPLKANELNPMLLNVCKQGDIELVQLFIDNGADKNYIDKSIEGAGNTPLMLASTNNHLEIVKILIDNDADLNLQNSHKCTPLWSASMHGHIDMVKLLLENGANPNIQIGEDKMTVLFSVAGKRFDENDIYVTTKRNLDSNDITLRVARVLLQNGANPNILNIHESNVLNLSARIGDIEMMKLLLDYGAKLDIQENTGLTPLMAASHANQLEACKLLIEYGANVNQTSSTQSATALTYAIENNNIDIVKLLVKEGADLNLVSSSSLDKHIWGACVESMKYGTPLKLAKKYGFKEIEQFLESHININETIEDFSRASLKLEQNLSIEVFKSYLLFKSKVGDEIFENKYLKDEKEQNTYLHDIKGKIILQESHVLKESKAGDQITYKILDFKGVYLDINNSHDPEALSKVLHNFSNNEKLRYTNHPWPKSSLTYEKFYNDIEDGWKEVEHDIRTLSPNLHKYITTFLFGDLENKVIGFSTDFIKEKLLNGETPDSIDELKKSIDTFKQSIFIKDDEGLKLIDLFERVLDKCPLDLNINLEEIEDIKERFYTNVRGLEDALSIILNDIYDINSNAKIKISVSSDDNIVDLKVIHENSSYPRTSENLKNTIGQTGNFTTIFDSLKSVCDWEVETTCKDGAKVIHYLYKQKDGKPYSEPSKEQNNISNFTHTLRFYK